jgi:hypothetical protein
LWGISDFPLLLLDEVAKEDAHLCSLLAGAVPCKLLLETGHINVGLDKMLLNFLTFSSDGLPITNEFITSDDKALDAQVTDLPWVLRIS